MPPNTAMLMDSSSVAGNVKGTIQNRRRPVVRPAGFTYNPVVVAFFPQIPAREDCTFLNLPTLRLPRDRIQSAGAVTPAARWAPKDGRSRVNPLPVQDGGTFRSAFRHGSCRQPSSHLDEIHISSDMFMLNTLFQYFFFKCLQSWNCSIGPL